MNKTIKLEFSRDEAEGLADLLAEQWTDRGFRELSEEIYKLIEEAYPPCPYDFSHTRHWCGNNTCRES